MNRSALLILDSTKWFLKKSKKGGIVIDLPTAFFQKVCAERFVCKENLHTSSIMASQQDAGDVLTKEEERSTSQHLGERVVATGKWLSLQNISYQDPKGRKRTWECLKRTTKHCSRAADGIAVIATLKRALKYDCLVFVKQYRPPLKAYTLEFPAGLIDEDESAEETALRELKEETGYEARIKHISPATCLDAGTEDCTIVIATAEIDGDAPSNLNPVQNADESEFIEVILIPIQDVLSELNAYSKKGVVVDARVYMYAIAFTQCTKPKSPQPDEK